MIQKIVLWGYMGSGKSTVGRQLAQKIGFPFYDLDSVLEQDHKQTITSLFHVHGAMGFRKLERKALQKLMQQDKQMVLALGGGTPCYFNQAEEIVQQPHTHVCYLKYSPKILSMRLFDEKNSRPIIAHLTDPASLEEYVAKHLFERREFYNQATHILEADGKDVQKLSDEIEAKLFQ